MRNSTDPCLLCQANLATKTNSHIYPKFLSTNFLGPRGQPRRGYDLDSDKVLDKKPKVIQDSPKEDYILCEECEAYFGVVEGIASSTFVNWKDKVGKGEFALKKIIDGLDILECNSADKRTVYLLIYSIFWRVSISSIDLFSNINIAKDFEEELRILLLTYRESKKTDYLNKLAAYPNFTIYPTSIMTAESFLDDTANLLFAPFTYDPYCLVVDRHSLMLFKTAAEIKTDFIRDFSNLGINDCRMMIFSRQLWYDTILKRPYELLVKQAIDRKKNS